MQTCCTLDGLAERFQSRVDLLRKRLVLRDMLADPSCELMCTDIFATLGDVEGVLILMQAELARRKTAISRVKVSVNI